MLGPSVDQVDAGALAETMRVTRPSLGVVLVRRRIDTAVLTDALRAGVREVVQERDLAGLTLAVRRIKDIAGRLRQQVPEGEGDVRHEPARGRVITVFSAKGGCGKTTLATNLAALLGRPGRGRSCLVDLDLAFGDVGDRAAAVPQPTPSPTRCRSATSLDGPARAVAADPARARAARRSCRPVEPGDAETIPATLVAEILDLLQAAVRLRRRGHPARVQRPRARRVRPVATWSRCSPRWTSRR